MLLETARTFFAIRPKTRAVLGSNPNAITDFDALFSFRAYLHGAANDLMAYANSCKYNQCQLPSDTLVE